MIPCQGCKADWIQGLPSYYNVFAIFAVLKPLQDVEIDLGLELAVRV